MSSCGERREAIVGLREVGDWAPQDVSHLGHSLNRDVHGDKCRFVVVDCETDREGETVQERFHCSHRLNVPSSQYQGVIDIL